MIAARMTALMFAVVAATPGHAAATTFHTLYAFSGGLDGSTPLAGLAAGAGPALYGTASTGGIKAPNGNADGQGVVFRIGPYGDEKTIFRFRDDRGATPQSDLTPDGRGAFYGTTSAEGTGHAGTVFHLTPDGVETVLHAFADSAGGGAPAGGVVLDHWGVLLGTGLSGGPSNDGVIYQITPGGEARVVHAFLGGHDGALPRAQLYEAVSGVVYGTTLRGGTHDNGTVFLCTSAGRVVVLHAFSGGADGGLPSAAVIPGAEGEFFGTTLSGGSYGGGIVFRLRSNGHVSVLHAFGRATDGANPASALLRVPEGDLYGTTEGGGTHGQGTVFRLSPDGHETILHDFTGGVDGAAPAGRLVMDANGVLYGTASAGGIRNAHCRAGCGTVFAISQ